MNVVMTSSSKNKDTYVQVRMRDDVKEDLRITAENRGLTISALLNSLIVKAIRQEKAESPEAFEEKPIGVKTTRRISEFEKKKSGMRVSPDDVKKLAGVKGSGK